MNETGVLKYIIDFDEKPAKEKLQSIKDDVTSVGDSVKALTEQKTDDKGEILTPGLENKAEIRSTLDDALSMVNNYTKSISKMGAGLKEVLLAPFSLMSSQVQQLDATLTKFSKKHLSAQEYEKYNNRAAAQAAAIAESREYANAALAGIQNPILKNKKIDSSLPFLRNLAVRMIEEDTTMNRSAMSLGSAAAFVGKTSQFRNAIRNMSGYQTADDRVYMEAAKALLASSPQARTRFLDTTGHLDKFKFSRKPIYSTNLEALPQNMQDVYTNKGIVQGKVSRGRNIRAAQDVYQKLVDLTDYGENHELVEMAREIGMMIVGDHNRNAGQKGRKQKTGQMHWRQEATMDQFDTLAGMTLKKLHEVRYGSPLYPRNPINNPSHSKTIMELNEILDILGQEKQLQPGILGADDIAHWGEYVQKNRNVDRSIVRTFRKPSLYVIPQTRIGANGEMVYSDPKTAARSKERTRQGLGDKDDDNFVAINDSLFARIAGFSPEDNNTYGHGTDASGQAVYGKPNVLKISASNLIPTNEFGLPIQRKPGQKVQPSQELLAYTEIMGNGGMYGTGADRDRYVFAWPAAQGKGAYMMPKSRVDAVKKHFEEDLFMPSPLEGFDSRGPIIEGNRERTSKLLNNLRKGASPGTPLIEHGFRLPSIKAIDYEAIDKLFEGSGFGEVLKNQIIDGLAYGNPNYIPTSLQGRLWGAPGKFMLQRMSLADLIDKSGAIRRRDASGNIIKDLSYNGKNNLNQLITPNAENGYGYSVWVPSLATRNLEINKDLLKPYGVESVQDLLANMKIGKYDAATAEEIRKSWLTDIMSNPDIMMTDTSVKNEDKFTVLPEAMYRGMFRIPKGQKIPNSRKDQFGRVLLTAPEAEQYMYKASEATYGPWAMKTNDEFEVAKDTMAVSAADAINYPPSLIRMSDRLYKAKLDRYADKAWLREHFLSQDQFAYKMENNPNWLESQEARSIIETEKQAIKADLDSRQKYLITTKNSDVLAQMLPGAGNDRLIKAIGGGEIDPNSEVAQLFPELYTIENLKRWGFDTTQLYDEVGALRNEFFIERGGKKVLDPTKYMYAPGWNHASAVAGRMPASPGTYGELVNLAYQHEKNNSQNMFMKAFHAVGNFDTDMAAVTPEGIQRMNTGDFDGDTIWLYAQMADDMMANLEAVNAPMDKAKAAAAKVRSAYDKIAEKKKLPNIYQKYYGDLAKENDIGQIRAGVTLNAQGAQMIMGQATAGIRNILTYGDLSNDETAEALQALVEYYDLGTSEVMNMGLEPTIQNDLAHKFMMSHRTYNRMMQQITQEESTGEPRIDSIFKYRPGSMTSPRDLAVMEMQSIGRSAYGSDQGLRERVLKAVDRRYQPGTKIHGMADSVANLIVDAETGYRFWPKSEVEGLYSLIPDIKMEAQNDQEQLDEVARIESFLTDYITSGPTLEKIQSLASGKGSIAEMASFLEKHQATEGEQAVHDELLAMIADRRKAVQEVEKLQAETANTRGISDEDLIKLGRIQDTTKLDKFQTSWSVTSVEPFMDAERSKAAMLPFLKDVKSYPLRGGRPSVGLSALANVNNLDFGSYESMAKKEYEELLNKNTDSFDTVLGTFMHSGFEDFFKAAAKPLAEGKTIPYTAGKFTQYLRQKLETGLADDGTSWRAMFDAVGVNIDDIISGFNNTDSRGNAAFGPSIEAIDPRKDAKGKLERIFGITYSPGADGKTHMSLGKGLPEELLASYFDDFNSPDQKIKRVVATENNIFKPNGDVVDVSKFADALPVDLPTIFGDRYVHAKPDLVYEGQDGRFHMMDYKSSSTGAVQALYQNAIYAEMLRKLGQASYEGFYEDGREVPESLKKSLEIYRQFVEKVDQPDGGSIYKSKIDTVQSFDLQTGRKNVVRIDENGIKNIYNEYLNGIRNKADKLKKGYIEGKMVMFNKGDLDSFAGNPELVMDQLREVQERAEDKEFRSDKNAARRQFLVEQFRKEQNELSEARSDLYKYKKQYGMVGKSPAINKFSSLIDVVEGGLSKDAMAAMYAEYPDSPEIQKIIADQLAGKSTAKGDLYSIIRQAAQQDPILARDKIASMVNGVNTKSSAMSMVDAIDKEVALARGSLSALKDDDSWDKLRNKWRDQDETIDLTNKKRDTEKEKADYAAAEAFNKREADRLMHAQQNKEAYEVGEQNLRILEAQLPEFKNKAFENETRHETTELARLIKEDDPYKNLAESINQRETELADYIIAKKLKIEELQQKLDEEKNGKFIISDNNDRNNIQNLINTLKSNVTQAEKKSGKAADEVVQNEMERLGIDAKTPQQKAKEWVDKRQAVIKAKANQDREQAIKEHEEAEKKQQQIRDNILNGHPDSMLSVDERKRWINSIHESDRLKQQRNKKLNDIAAYSANKLDIYKNLGVDIQNQMNDEEELRLRQAEILASGGSMSRKDRIKEAASKRFESILKIGQSLPAEQQDAYWKTHTYDQVTKQVTEEIDANRSILDFQYQQQNDIAQYQNMVASRQRQHAMDRQYKNMMNPARSRLVQAYRSQQEQVYNFRQQEADAQHYKNLAQEKLDKQTEAFNTRYGVSFDEYQKMSDEDKAKLESKGDVTKDAQAIRATQTNFEKFAQAEKDAAAGAAQFGGAMPTIASGLNAVDNSLTRIMHRFGRRMFMRIIQETKQFIKQFDASMNEIQTITLKSTDEMAEVRSKTIGKAISMRTSVSNVANVEAALYRQGLSDSEVSKRTNSIIQFATVAKLNVQDATKIITTALQNDLVASANEAMDALVALGDSAATTAAEIGKGMQKAAAAAKVAGVSYAELTALLTIGTSDTQLSGTQVGTALQTVFSRMRRLSVSGWAADQNGTKTSASDAEAALRAVGIDLWDDKTIGKMRSGYDVLLDLSKIWQTLSDAQKNIVMNAMAGTRQTNIFSTLMEGMSEDNGETLEKYLGLSEGSQGITQSKYEIAMQSLSASMNELKSSWDSVVESFTNSGIITESLDGLSGFLQTISGVAENGGKIGIGLSAVAAGVSALLLSLMPGGKILAILGAVAAFVGGIGITSLFTTPTETTESINNRALEGINYSKKYTDASKEKYNNAIDEVEKAGKAWNELNSAENTDNLTTALENLKTVFPSVGEEVENAIANLNDWTKAVDAARDKTNEFTKENIKTVIDKTKQYVQTNLPSDYVSYVEKKFTSAEDKQKILNILNDEKGNEYRFKDNADGFMDINDLSAFSDQALAFIMTRAYRKNKDFRGYADQYLDDATKEVINDTSNKTPWDDEAFVAAAGNQLRYMLSQLQNIDSWSLLTDMSAALNYRKEQMFDLFNPDSLMGNGVLDFDKLLSSTPYTVARTLANAAAGSRELQTWMNDNGYGGLLNGLYSGENSTINANVLKERTDDFVEMASVLSGALNTGSKRQATRLFLKEKLADVLSSDFEMMAESDERLDAEQIQQMFINMLSEEMQKPEFFAADGSYDKKALQAFIDRFLDGWYENTSEYLNEQVDNAFTAKDFNYHFDETDSKTWFKDYDKAIEYALANGIDPTTLKTSTGANAYQGVSALITGANINTNTNNQYDTLDIIRRGDDDALKNLSINHQKNLATVLARDNETDYDETLKQIQNGDIKFGDLTSSQQNAVKRISKFILPASFYDNFEALFADYDTEGKSSLLSSFISSNADAMSAYLNNDYDAFLQAINNAQPGQNTQQTRAQFMKQLGSKFKGNAEAVKEFRTNTLSAETYKNWQSLFGDQADAILDALANDTLTGDLLDYYNETIANASIAFGTGMKQFTSTDTARLAQRVLNVGDITKAKETLGYDEDQWKAISDAYPELQRYLQMSESQRKTQEGQNLLRDINIKIHVSGISELEEAGKVLEGTKDLIEALEKGGEIAIKASLSYDQNFEKNIQHLAILQNGTYSEVTSVLREMGYSDDAIFNSRKTTTEEATRRAEEKAKQVGAASLNALYMSGQEEEAARLAREGGYTGQLGWYQNNEGEYRYGYFNYQYTGKPEVKRTNPLSEIENYYTDTQIAEGMADLIEGTLTQEENPNLYKAVADRLGSYGKEYVRMQNENILTNEAGQTLEQVKGLALEEAFKASVDAFSSDLTKRLEASADDAIRNNASSIVSAASTLLYGTAAEQNDLFNNAASQARSAKTALTALDQFGNTEQGRQLIDAYLGIGDEALEDLLNSENGKENVRQQINDKAESYKTTFTQAVNALLPDGQEIEIDFEDIESTSKAIEEALSETDNGIASLLIKWLNAITGINVRVNESIADVNKKEKDENTQKKTAFDAVSAMLKENNLQAAAKTLVANRNIDATQLSPALRTMIESVANGENIFTAEDIKTVYENEMYDRSASGANQKAIIKALFGENATASSMAKNYKSWLENRPDNLSRLNLLESLPDQDKLKDILLGDYTDEQRNVLLNDYIAGLGTANGTGLEQFTSEETAKLAKDFLQAKDWNEIQSKYNKDQIDAVTSKYGDIQRYMQMDSEQRQSVEGKNIKRDIDIAIDVVGIQQLEEAGALLEGTAATIEKLKKGGRFEIEAIVNITSSAYNRGQQEAKLLNGTAYEQDEIAKSLLNMSDEVYYANRDLNLQMAQRIMNGDRDGFIKQANEYYNNLTSEEDKKAYRDLMAGIGYNYNQNIPTVSDYKLPEGYTIRGDTVVDNWGGLDIEETEKYRNSFKKVSDYKLPEGYAIRGDVVVDNWGGLDIKETEKYRNSFKEIGFEFDGAGNVIRSNAFAGKQKSYTDAELAAARQEILAGTLTPESLTPTGESDYARYLAAANSMGYYSGEYARQKYEYDQGISKTAPTARLKQLAEAETEQARITADEQQALDEARLSATTTGGALAYANLRYQQNNKAGFAANEIYRSLSGANVKTVSDLAKAVESTDVKNWKDLLESSEDVRKAFKDVGIQVGKEGLDFSNVDQSADGLSNALNILTQAVAGASEEYNKQAEVLSTGELYERAAEYMSGAAIDEEKGFEAFSQVVGNSQVAQIVRNNYLDYKNGVGFNVRQGDYFSNGQWYNEQGQPLNWNYDSFAGMTAYNRRYAQTLMNNASLGISGLTELQRAEGLQNILAEVEKGRVVDENGNLVGGIEYLRTQDKVGAFADYTSGMTDANKWLAASEALEKQGLKMSDLAGLEEGTEKYNKAQEAIKGIYGSMEDAIQAQQTWDNELQSKSITLANKYGDATATVASNVEALAKGGKPATQTIAQLRQQMSQMNNAAEAIKASRGKTGAELTANQRSDLSAVTGENVDLIKEMSKEEVESLANRAQESIDTDFVQVIGGSIQERLTKLMQENPVEFEMAVQAHVGEDGQLDLSEIAAIAAELQEKGLEELASYAGKIGELYLEFVNGDMSKEAFLKFISGGVKGSGKRSGGGGGGGGKTPAQRAIEKAKRSTVDLEHELKMSQTRQTYYLSQNNNESYTSELSHERDLYMQLSEAYRQNIDDLRAQRVGLTEADDDYWSLTDAINGYLESLENVSNQLTENTNKTINLIKKQQEYEDSLQTHTGNLIESRMQYAQLTENTEAYSEEAINAIRNNADKQGQNRAQIKQWEDKLKEIEKTEGKDSDNYRTVQQDIWTTEEENAALDNDSLQKLKDLQNYRTTALQTAINRSTQVDNGRGALASTYAQIEATQKNYLGQQKYLSTVVDSRRNVANKIREQIPLLQENLKKQSYGTAEWDQAFQALNQAEQDAANAEMENINAQQEYDSSVLTAITEGYADATREMTHYAEVSSSVADIYRETESFDAYRNILEDQITLYEGLRKASQEEADSLREQLSLMDESNPKYTEVSNALNEAENNNISYTKSILDNTKAIQENLLEENKLITTRKLLASMTNTSLLGTYSEMYKSNGEFDAYRQSIEKINNETWNQEQINAISANNLTKMLDEMDQKRANGEYVDPAVYQSIIEERDKLVDEVAKGESTRFNNRSKINKSYIEESQYNVNRENVVNDAIMSLANTYLSAAEQTEDYATQRSIIKTRMGSRKNSTLNLMTEANDLLRYAQTGEFNTEQDQMDAYKAAIDMMDKARQSYSQDIQDQLKLDSINLQEITQNYNDATREMRHQINLNAANADYALTIEDFENYRNLLGSTSETLKKLIPEQESYISDLKVHAEEVKNDASAYRTTQDAIESAENQLAAYNKQLAENTRQIEENRLAQMNLALTRASLASRANASLAGTYASTYESRNNYEQQRNMLAAENTNNAAIREMNDKAIENLRNALLKEGEDAIFTTPQARESAIKKLNELITENANLNANDIANNAAIERSRISQIKWETELGMQRPQFMSDILNEAASRYQTTGNFEEYRKMMVQEQGYAGQMLVGYNEARRRQAEHISEMEIGTPEWQEAVEYLNELDKQIVKLKISSEEAAEAIEKSLIEQIAKTFEDETRWATHDINTAGTYGSMYNEAQMYDDYRTMLQTQINDRNRIEAAYDQSITEYENRLASGELDGTALYDETVQKLYSARESRDQNYAEIIKAQNEIYKSRSSEVLKNRQKRLEPIDFELSMYEAEASYYEATENVEGRTSAINRQIEALQLKQEVEKEELQNMINIANETPRNTEAYEDLQKEIYSSAKNIAEMDTKLISLSKTVQSVKIDDLLEIMERTTTLYNHTISMIGSQRDYYDTLGEYSNVNAMYDEENKQLESRNIAVESYINELKSEIETMEASGQAGSDAYWKLVTSLTKYEEELSSNTATIEKNKKAQEENRKKILETRTTMEEAVRAELDARKQRDRDMLAGEVSLQDTILDTIKERYSKEWDLMQKDLDKRKQALNDEKNLLNQRLNARKDAMNKETQYEELAEYQRQLALISADSTRTKEAKELQRKIEEIQKNMSIQIAEDETNAQIEQIDSQLTAIDDEIEYRQQKLDDLLKDSNNFADEMNDILSKSFDEITNWLAANNENYKTSTEKAREQMIEGWEDTYNQWKNINERYLSVMNEVLATAESYMAFFDSPDGIRLNENMSEAEKELEKTAIAEESKNRDNAFKTGATFEHDDDYVVQRIAGLSEENRMNLIAALTGMDPYELNDYQKDYEYGPNQMSLLDIDWGSLGFNVSNTEIKKAIENAQKNTEGLDIFTNEWFAALRESLDSEMYDALLKKIIENYTTIKDEEQKTTNDILKKFSEDFKKAVESYCTWTAKLIGEPLSVEDRYSEGVLTGSGEEGSASVTGNLATYSESINGYATQVQAWIENKESAANKFVEGYDAWRTNVHEVLESYKLFIQHDESEDEKNTSRPNTSYEEGTLESQAQQINNITQDIMSEWKKKIDEYLRQIEEKQKQIDNIQQDINDENKNTSPGKKSQEDKEKEKSILKTAQENLLKMQEKYKRLKKLYDKVSEFKDVIDIGYPLGVSEHKDTSYQFASGGLVDFTGPAWVDGTKSKPEAFLSAYDTETMRKMLDAFNYIRVAPSVMPIEDYFRANNNTVGDINITINQAELKDDADYEDVARRVGRAFTKELTKNGFNLAGYSM